jgi:protein-S-isoprenylcysteine O-methyltransferase Ste14
MRCWALSSAAWRPERAVGERRGMAQRIARLRVPLGFVGGAAAFWLAQPTVLTLAVGSVVAVAGEAIRIWAAGHLNKSREVTSSGPYRWSAHPLYLGSSVMGAGLAIAGGSAIVAGLVVAYLGLTLTAAIRTEESFLRNAFGDQYERYRRDGVIDNRRRFSLRLAVTNREYRAVGGSCSRCCSWC